MEVFKNDMIIRLKNGQEKYLIAQQDKDSVSKSKDGFTKNAQWTIEVNDEESVYFKSCYGKYLTASNQPSIPGMVARNLRVTQTLPEKKNTSHLWIPVGPSDPREPNLIWLRTLHGSYLKAHSGPSSLKTLITHDLIRKDKPESHNKKILWQVEVVDFPSEVLKHSESVMSKMLFGVRSFVSEKNKDKEKNKGSKDEKESRKGRIPKVILSRKFNCKTM